MSRYDGGKNREGVYHRIINQIPPHTHYIECFAGSGAILRLKKPALYSVAVERDPSAANALRFHPDLPPMCSVYSMDALEFLRNPCLPDDPADPQKVFLYCDPPYLFSTRAQQEPLYRQEFGTEDEHRSLLTLLLASRYRVMLSGYDSPLYREMLSDWRVLEYETTTRTNRRVIECLWMNYPEPVALHDYRYYGAEHRERYNLTRQKRRWRARLEKMPALQRYALLSALEEFLEIGASEKKEEEC